jgi:hypothetical protein
MKIFVGFISTFIVNLIVLLLANHFLPQNYVLLSYWSSWWFSFLSTAFVWALIVWLTQPIAGWLKFKIKKGLKLILVYLLTNFVALWGITRIGLGFGVTSSVWTLALAVVANIVQFTVWTLLTKFKLTEM